MRQETEFHFLFGTVIFGILSIFKKSQASSPYEALNSCVSRGVRGMWGPLSRWGGHLQLSLGFPKMIQTWFNLVKWKTSVNLSHCREIGPSLSQGLLGSIPLETENTGSLTNPYCWDKTPLEELLESWHTSSVKDRESAVILGRYGVHGAFLELLNWN